MRHAREDYNRIQDPANLIPEDEPVFLIRAQDANSGEAVRDYAVRALRSGASPELVQRCFDHAKLMDAWPKKKVPDLAK